MVRAFLPRRLGTDDGGLFFDETGQARKGPKTAASGRQYSGAMGRVENVIVAVYTMYATERGHALVDRDLYVQADWFADPARMATAGSPGITHSPPSRRSPSHRRNGRRPPGSDRNGRPGARCTGAAGSCACSQGAAMTEDGDDYRLRESDSDLQALVRLRAFYGGAT